MPFQSRAWSVAQPRFRESGAVVADDIYSGTKHDGASVSSLYLLEEMESKTKLLFQYILRLKCPSFVLELFLFRHWSQR